LAASGCLIFSKQAKDDLLGGELTQKGCLPAQRYEQVNVIWHEYRTSSAPALVIEPLKLLQSNRGEGISAQAV
jgi:hypothetical protein